METQSEVQSEVPSEVKEVPVELRSFKYFRDTGTVAVSFVPKEVIGVHFVVFGKVVVEDEKKILAEEMYDYADSRKKKVKDKDAIKFFEDEIAAIKESLRLEVEEKSKARVGTVVSRAIGAFELDVADEFVHVDSLCYICDYGVVVRRKAVDAPSSSSRPQTKGSRAKVAAPRPSYYHCLANDICRRKKTVISITPFTPRFPGELCRKGEFDDVVDHLKEKHWTQELQASVNAKLETTNRVAR